jgi:hypothetical protein
MARLYAGTTQLMTIRARIATLLLGAALGAGDAAAGCGSATGVRINPEHLSVRLHAQSLVVAGQRDVRLDVFVSGALQNIHVDRAGLGRLSRASYDVLWGDSSQIGVPVGGGGCAAIPPPPKSATTFHETLHFRHHYRRPGVYLIGAGVRGQNAGCGGAEDGAQIEVRVQRR